jgi:hypothetical protein
MLVARLRLLLGAVLLLTMFAVAPPASAQQRNPDGSVNPTARQVPWISFWWRATRAKAIPNSASKDATCTTDRQKDA